MKIYTGTGDSGKTSLFSGERIAKTDQRVEAYGAMDELSSILGVLVAYLPEGLSPVASELRQIQADLFQMGAWLATTPGSPMIKQLQPVTLEPVTRLEKAIDRMDAKLPTQKVFILPGGHISAAYAHVARTTCRRTERQVIRLTHPDKKDSETTVALEHIQVYLNRLSDYLFVLARTSNAMMSIPDIPWGG